MAGATLLTSSCNDWLDVLPKNEQVSPEYWKTKEQVEEVLAQGYQNMRLTVPTLIYWGELRGASIYDLLKSQGILPLVEAKGA